ncbi:LysR family transcriptional regulator [Psychromonas sp. CNPT3]|uniref:LysR family transcriptional regulator n=1 Tax=Psychromonas sp. CNPT3 TaxID=314282 RepID=UPI00006E3F87|nr:LysR family transcriptional regulator [Psychromonas sp. CNPT3]AGH81045.1 LysR family transcriptional regulator [Psychromonas sp. CNPT3]
MLDLIRVFIQTVDSGSFTKAGAVLNMVPSSIARNIDNLEKELGVTLFKRSTRQLLITEDGQQFLGGATKLLQDADNLVASMSKINREPEGILKISVFESFGRQCISPILPEFLQRYPKVQVEIELDNQMIDLNSENVDIGIRIGRPADSCLHARMLLTNHTLLCASADYLEKYGTPKTPKDLIHHNCLLLANDKQRTYWYFNKNKQHLKIPVRGNLRSKGGTPLLEAAIYGGGIVQMSRWMMTPLIASGKVIVCLADWKASLYEGSSAEIYAVYHGSKYPRPALRAFLDFLMEKVNDKTL